MDYKPRDRSSTPRGKVELDDCCTLVYNKLQSRRDHHSAVDDMEDPSLPSDKLGKLVAYLRFHHAAEPAKDEHVPVYADEEFDIGRANVPSTWNMNRMSISTHHLRFHCVSYEDDAVDPSVLPMVYFRVLSSHFVHLRRWNFNSSSRGDPVSKTDGDILLNHMDVLQLTPMIRITFSGTEDEPLLDLVQRRETQSFAHQYRVTNRILGKGGQASVVLAIKTSNHRQYACKIVSVPEPQPVSSITDAETTKKQRTDMAREYTILKNLNHPNVISLEKVFCSERNTYIFQELVTGGDLLSYIDKKSQVGSPQAAVLVLQILKAVNYLHEQHIVHRDIKPENVLLTSWRDGARIVLTDFGQARYLPDSIQASKAGSVFRMQSKVGTFGYLAPEVASLFDKKADAQKGYSKAIDIWSIGCLTAILLTGEPLLGGCKKDSSDLASEIQTYPAQLATLDTGDQWKKVSCTPKSFIKGCLVIDEDQRFTVKQALQHEWFTNKQYASEMSAAYQRAIQDWKPRTHSDTPIEFLNTKYLPSPGPSSGIPKSTSFDTNSHHFPIFPSSRPLFSPNLSTMYDSCKRRNHTPLPAINDNLFSPHPKTQPNAIGNPPMFVTETPQRPRQAKSRCIASNRQELTTQESLRPPMSFNESLFRVYPEESQYPLPLGHLVSDKPCARETRKRSIAPGTLPMQVEGTRTSKRMRC